jgi:hypothetical protein
MNSPRSAPGSASRSSRTRPHHGWQKPRPSYTLKDAASDLIEACGGLKAAAEILGLSIAQTGRYADPAYPRVHLTIDGLLRLAQASGEVGVLSYLADRLGYALIPLEPVVFRADLGAEMAGVGERSAQLFQRYGKALTDAATPGRIDPFEAADMAAAALELQRQLATLTAALQQILGEGL